MIGQEHALDGAMAWNEGGGVFGPPTSFIALASRIALAPGCTTSARANTAQA
jgi:hypothetical protein